MRRIRIYRLSVVAAVLALLIWLFVAGSSSDFMALARLAPHDTLVWVGFPDLPRWVRDVESTGVAARLSRSTDWTSFLQEPGVREIVEPVRRQWPRMREMMDRAAAVGLVADASSKTVRPVMLIELKRSVAAAGTIEGLFDSSGASMTFQGVQIRSARVGTTPVYHALLGRVLVLSPSPEGIHAVVREDRGRDHPVAKMIETQMAGLKREGADPLVYVSPPHLRTHADLVPGLSAELWWMAPFLDEGSAALLTVRVGDSVSWRGTLEYRDRNLGITLPGGSPQIFRFMTRETAIQSTRTVDFPSLWEEMMKRTAAGTRRAIEEEIIFFNKNLMDRRDFVRDFLPMLGPEWGLAVIHLDQDRFQIKAKHALPVVQAFMRIRDPWAAEKIHRMVLEGYARIQKAQQKKKAAMPFALEQSHEDGRMVIRIVLQGEEANRLGAAFAPGIVIARDTLILTSFLPYTRQMFSPMAPGYQIGQFPFTFSIAGAPLLRVAEGLRDAIADTIVNDRFRKEVEPQADKLLAERFQQGELQKVLEYIRKDLRQAGAAEPEDLEREAQFFLSKYIYEERLKLIERELSALSHTKRYTDVAHDMRDRVNRWIRRVGLLERMEVSSFTDRGMLRLQGRLDVNTPPR